MKAEPEPASEGTEELISRILKHGVNLSIGLVCLGSLLGFIRGDFSGGPEQVKALCGDSGSFPRTLSWILGGLVHARGPAIVVCGLVVLIATPVIRIVVSMFSFARQGDRRFVAITAAVLALLLLSLLLGKAG